MTNRKGNVMRHVVVPVFTQPDPLPRAQSDTSITNGKCQVGAQETRLGVGGHVVRAFTAVLEGDGLRDQPVQHHLHVVPHVWVPVLVDGERGGCVEELDVHQSD